MHLYPLPKELLELMDKPIWGLFTRNETGPKYTVAIINGGKACSSNDKKTLLPLNKILAMKKHNQYVVMSVILANTYLYYKLNFLDIDGEKDGFDPHLLMKFLANPDTYAEISPSGRGYHVFYFTDKNTRLKELETKGYDTTDRGFVTMTFNPVAVLPILKVQGQEYYKAPPSEPLQLMNGKSMSVIYCFNKQNTVESVLKHFGYIQKGKKFLYPYSTSGVAGILINPSIKGDWDSTFSFHHDDPLYGKVHDPFSIVVLLEYNNNVNEAIAALSKKIKALDPKTLKPIDKMVDAVNRDCINFEVFPAEPIQRMIDAYKDTISTPIPMFYLGTIYSHLSLFLQNTVRMPLMKFRGTNTLFMMLAYSAAGKDNNISVPTHGIGRILSERAVKKGMADVNSLLQGMIHRMPKVTTLSALLKVLGSEDEGHSDFGRIWMDTDCKDLLGKFSASNKSMAGISAITDAIIEIADGVKITGMGKANESLAGYDEALPVLLASQTDIALELFTDELMARGFFGRFDFLLYKDSERSSILNPFVDGNVKPFEINDEELLDFLLYVLDHANTLRNNDISNYVVAELDDGGANAAKEWFQKYVSGPSENWSEDRKKFISRISMSLEKMGTIDATLEHLWKCFKAGDTDPFGTQITIKKHNMERYFSYCEYQINVRNGEVLNLIKSKPKSKLIKQQDRIMKCLKELINAPVKGKERFSMLNVEVALQHRLIGRSILTQMSSIPAKEMAEHLTALQDVGLIKCYNKGEKVTHPSGTETKLQGMFVGFGDTRS